jgi:DnaK suppressor protein
MATAKAAPAQKSTVKAKTTLAAPSPAEKAASKGAKTSKSVAKTATKQTKKVSAAKAKEGTTTKKGAPSRAKSTKAKAAAAKPPVKKEKKTTTSAKVAKKEVDTKKAASATQAVPAPSQPAKKSEPVATQTLQVQTTQAKLPKKLLNELKQMLLSERERVLAELRGLDDQTMNNSEADNESSLFGVRPDPADSAADSQEMEIHLGLMNLENEQLREIEEALAMIETGNYGICQACGQPISVERLRIRPMARFCVPCLQKREKGRF